MEWTSPILRLTDFLLVADSAKFKMKYVNVKYQNWSCQDFAKRYKTTLVVITPPLYLCTMYLFLIIWSPMYLEREDTRQVCRGFKSVLIPSEACVSTSWGFYRHMHCYHLIPCKQRSHIITKNETSRSSWWYEICARRGRGGYSNIVWVGVWRWVRESPTLYQTKFCDSIPE